MDKVLILGGTGFVGRSLSELLVGHAGGRCRITVPSRQPTQAKRLQALATVRLVAADVHDPTQLAQLVEGHDAVVSLVGVLHGSEAHFRRAHVDLPRKLAGACVAAGVRRVLHVSALGVGDDGPSLYLRSKAQGEAVLRSADLDLTILRPSVIFGAEDRFMNLFARLQKFAPFVPLANAQARFQPVWVQDVASAIVACLDKPATAGKVFECAGPDVFTLGELVKLAGRWAGHERPVMPLPASVGRLQAALMELLPGEPLMSRDNLDSMRTPNIASGRLPSLHDLGINATPLGRVAPRYLSKGP
jgi:NADH dehydrogenase